MKMKLNAMFVCLFVESDLEQSHNKSGRKTQEQFRITLNVSEITEKKTKQTKQIPHHKEIRTWK